MGRYRVSAAFDDYMAFVTCALLAFAIALGLHFMAPALWPFSLVLVATTVASLIGMYNKRETLRIERILHGKHLLVIGLLSALRLGIAECLAGVGAIVIVLALMSAYSTGFRVVMITGGVVLWVVSLALLMWPELRDKWLKRRTNRTACQD